MPWNKLGLVFTPNGQRPWMRSHATHPIVLPLSKDAARVYFSCRDAENRSHTGFVELALPDFTVTRVAEYPALAPGPLGHFDDHGVYAGCIVPDGERLLMYYIGWNPGCKGPLFYSDLGLAESRDGGETFTRHSAGPILARGDHDPCSVLLPFVLREGGGWRMWYGSGFRWEQNEDGLHSYYDIKYAHSTDGVAWTREGHVAIPLAAGEFNTAHPFVRREDEGLVMWYSYNRGDGYRIGTANSRDGLAWTRRDDLAGIDVSQSGFDSQIVSHPFVFDHCNTTYMLYNGNGFGKDGIALARWEDPA